jgi:outer membrane receptor protein involved in Fe transport
MIKTKLFALFLLSILMQMAYAQQDSSNLELKRLNTNDVISSQNDSLIQQVVSVTRSAIPLSQSPFETYVITQEEIRRFGCNTLVDVLRLVPGIRTSKIGSAMEGELFMTNGLRGNTYFQFLINDVPIRPSTTRGMSLSAQLPIKQAERIEIQLGSATAEYGMLAGGGVINIILKESQRPVYASAELNFSPRNDYNNIDVNFGGKIGKGKRIASFNAFGGFSLTKNRPINGEDYIYQSKTYLPNREDTLYLNGRDWKFIDTPFVAIDYNLPTFSRYAGLNIKYRNLTLAFYQNSRREHSAIGLNPSVLSYVDEDASFQDNVYSLNLGLNRTRRNTNIRWNIGYIKYSISPSSSALYYAPSAGLFLDSILAYKQLPNKSKIYFNEARTRLSERPRYFSGCETQLPFLWNINQKIGKHLHIGGGFFGDLTIYSTQFAYEANQLQKNKIFPDVENSQKDTNLVFNGTLNGRISYEAKSTFIFLDANRGVRLAGFRPTPFSNLRLGVNQKVNFNQTYYYLKGNINKSQLPINNYYANNELFAYFYRDSNQIAEQAIAYRNYNANAKVQNLTEAQFIIQKLSKFADTRLQYQYHKINNIPLFYNYKQYDELPKGSGLITNQPVTAFSSGFDFNPNDYTLIHQIKFSTVLNTNASLKKLTNSNGILMFRYAFTKQWGEERLNNVKYNYVRQLPKNISQLGFYFKPFTSLSVGMSWNYNSSFYASNDKIRAKNDNKPSNSFHTIDFYFDYSVSDNLSLRMNIYNAFNKKVYGIDASETTDDLLFNMQPKRFTQIGIIYNLDNKPKNNIDLSVDVKKENPKSLIKEIFIE